MMITLAEAVFLMSVYKPILFALVLGVWGWIVSNLDKDTEYFFLQRKLWNAVHIGVGMLAFWLWLLIPYFWLGLPVALVLTGGAIGGYIYYRNGQVPEQARWTLSLDSFRNRMDKMQAASARKNVTMTLMSEDDAMLEVPVGDTPQAKAHQVLEQILEFALPRGADQIEVAVDSTRAAVAVRVDGVRYPQPTLEPAVAVALIDYMKGAAGLDLADRRRKQSGTTIVNAGELGKHQLGVITSGSTQAMQMVIPIDPVAQASIPLDQMGMLEAQCNQLIEVLDKRGGTVIVSCPPQHGQTSTLYTLLQRHDPYTQSVYTLEDKHPFEIEGVNHEKLPPDADPEKCNQIINSMLRRDPAVLFYDRRPDPVTAKTIARYSDEVRFYVGMTKEDTFSALRAWVKLVGSARAATEHLGVIVSQRLVRKLCPTCRTQYAPDAAALRKFNLPADKIKRLYKASGQVMVNKKPRVCPDCLGMGYKGRTGVFEVMVFDEQARKMLADKQIEQLRSHLRKQKMLWLQEAALAKVVEGVTDIKEVTRALSGIGDKSGGSAAGRSGPAARSGSNPAANAKPAGGSSADRTDANAASASASSN